MPGARFDGNAWLQGRIEEAVVESGPWTALETVALDPIDVDPADPQARNFTTGLATSATGWFRVVFIDAAAHEQESGAVYVAVAGYSARGETVSELLEQVVEEGGFDISNEAALRAFNQQHRKMVVRSRCLRREMLLGDTVADQQAYSLDPDIVEVLGLTLDGVPWKRTGGRSWAALRAGTSVLRGVGGVYAEWPDASGNEQLVLYPVPAVPAEMRVLVALRPQDLLTTDHPQVPSEYHEALVDATVGVLLGRVDERLGDAAAWRASFDMAIEELRRESKSRFRSGPGQIQVVGYHV